MGKKKKAAEDDGKHFQLGRPGNNVKMGVVGLPNVGKSSFFNLMCGMNVPAENYPFCTIDPSVSRVPVPDKRYNRLCKAFSPKKEIPAVLTVTDIAGLVKGAAEGAGLGNAFLANVQAVDAIYHMVRIFKNAEVTHVEESIDPLRDMDIINNELLAKDKQILHNLVEGKRKNIDRGVGGKEAKAEWLVWCKALEWVSEGKHIRFNRWLPFDIEVLNQLQLMTAKPQIYLVNMGKKGFVKRASNWLPKVAQHIQEHGGEPMIPFSVAYEKERFECGDDAAQAAFDEQSGAKSMFTQIIKMGYKTLRLINFFTVGPDEVRAWTIQQGWLAPQAAGTIHTDFEKGFICANIYAFKDFRQLGSEKEVKDKGKLRQEGKKYVMQDGDICHFSFNPPKSGKKK